jgi:hypothetical protein
MNWKTIGTLFASGMLIGCGGMGMQTSNMSPAAPTGQWEFTISSASGNPNVYVESDLIAAPMGETSSNMTGTALYWNQNGGSLALLYSYCLGVHTALSMSGNNITAQLFEGGNEVAQATATLSVDGKTMNGSYQLTSGTQLCGTPVATSGTFMGQAIAPLNGTYKGTLSDGNQWTVQITQSSGFDIMGSGTTIAQGVTTNFSFGPNSSSPGYNNVIGATVSGNGTATNVNGSQNLQIFGHFLPDASQVSFVINDGSQLVIGTLAKQ